MPISLVNNVNGQKYFVLMRGWIYEHEHFSAVFEPQLMVYTMKLLVDKHFMNYRKSSLHRMIVSLKAFHIFHFLYCKDWWMYRNTTFVALYNRTVNPYDIMKISILFCFESCIQNKLMNDIVQSSM